MKTCEAVCKGRPHTTSVLQEAFPDSLFLTKNSILLPMSRINCSTLSTHELLCYGL